MGKTFAVTFDTRELDSTTAQLDQVIYGDAIEREVIRAVNEVTDRAYDTVRRRMNAGINLDDPYIGRKLKVVHATNVPSATITASGDLTLLSRYNPRLVLKPVLHPGRAKGDPSRGIAPGLKAAGITVQVSRTAPKRIAHGFLMPLRNGSGVGVFARGADGRVTNRYGPSVYQLFRATLDVSTTDIADDLELTATDAIQLGIQKALA
jgi:hypothetical protein